MTEAIDQILLSWLEETPGVPRRERQALLLKELMAVHTLRSLAACDSMETASSSDLIHAGAAPSAGRASKGSDAEEELYALAERETKLCTALQNTLLEVVDVAEARRLAESLTVSTDLDVLYGTLDPHCVMTLRVVGDGARQPPAQLRGVDDIINELSEFQESVLLLRVDSATSPQRSHNGIHGSSRDDSKTQNISVLSPPTIAVRSVSPVQSWTAQCEVELEMGTQVTYYANADCTKPLFDLRSSFLFSADGAKVERITRELLPRGGHHLDDLLRVLHFGRFLQS